MSIYKTIQTFPTYDYKDLASGTGIIEFYPGNAGTDFILADNKFYSEKTLSEAIQNASTGGWIIDKDFDVMLNLPRTLKGTCIVSVPIGVQSSNGGTTCTTYIKATLRKWDGVTETDIATATGTSWVTSPANPNMYDYNLTTLKMTIPSTHIKKGEYIRLTIELHGTCGAGNPCYFFFGHDPMNRASSDYNAEEYPVGGVFTPLTFGTEPSILTAQIPFRIDQ